MASTGKGRRAKGHTFERRVARDLRAIYDGPDWCAHYDTLSKQEQSIALKTSRVRRGEQAHGALEADLVVAGVHWWFELQHANRAQPLKKLEQAERDIVQGGETAKWLAVSITLETGHREVKACMRARSFCYLMTGLPSSGVFGPVDSAPVVFPYSALLELLRLEDAVR
jgi:hypothetical protein